MLWHVHCIYLASLLVGGEFDHQLRIINFLQDSQPVIVITFETASCKAHVHVLCMCTCICMVAKDYMYVHFVTVLSVETGVSVTSVSRTVLLESRSTPREIPSYEPGPMQYHKSFLERCRYHGLCYRTVCGKWCLPPWPDAVPQELPGAVPYHGDDAGVGSAYEARSHERYENRGFPKPSHKCTGNFFYFKRVNWDEWHRKNYHRARFRVRLGPGLGYIIFTGDYSRGAIYPS